MRDIPFLTPRPSFCVTLLLLSFFTLCPFPGDVLVEWPLIKIHNIAMAGILCDDTKSERSKNDNLLQFNTSWLASLRTWHYPRLCFSFSCSGYDLTSNCYLFLQNVLLKQKLANSLLVTVVALFTAKLTYSEKAIYVLSLKCLVQ